MGWIRLCLSSRRPHRSSGRTSELRLSELTEPKLSLFSQATIVMQSFGKAIKPLAASTLQRRRRLVVSTPVSARKFDRPSEYSVSVQTIGRHIRPPPRNETAISHSSTAPCDGDPKAERNLLSDVQPVGGLLSRSAAILAGKHTRVDEFAKPQRCTLTLGGRCSSLPDGYWARGGSASRRRSPNPVILSDAATARPEPGRCCFGW